MSITKKKKKKAITSWYAKVRSRHPSHEVLRRQRALLLPFRSVVRFGSDTPVQEVYPKSYTKGVVEINTTKAISNSSSKFNMKDAFMRNNVESAPYFHISMLGSDKLVYDAWEEHIPFNELPYPLVAKKNYGSRGQGMRKLENEEELRDFLAGNTNGYYLEKYLNYSREYRLHVTKNGCFYTCRKMLKSDTSDDIRWFRNDSNCVWYVEENENFNKPGNWDKIVAESVKALNAVGLDIGACDVRVSAKNDKETGEQKFAIIEINSAPSFGDRTEEEYLKVLPKLIRDKYRSLG
jgi:glutathione synthase/RimK-type ligase-like ATP-grasp enzyme